ncbi:discoidin domain-containing protein [Paenibacillus sp. S-12]|uniref:discoidin domain-containing protein n=1 Tax=Paenibacillus sp. S-12 TaxID=3031371 RepID=UPI00338DF632
MDWENARAKTYKLLVSDGNQHWISVIKGNDEIITAHAGKETVHFDPVKARYVKFQGVQKIRNTDIPSMNLAYIILCGAAMR